MSPGIAQSATPPKGLERLVLLGAGPVSLQIMAALAKQAIVGVQVTLVAPHRQPIMPAMLASFVAGHNTLEECSINLAAWVQHAGIEWIERSVRKLNAQEQTLELNDGSMLAFDWLCIDSGLTQNREYIENALPGARKNAMFVHPVDAFAALWPQVAAKGDAQAMRITVVGAGATGIELVLAIRHRLPNAALTLLCGAAPPAANYPVAVQQRVQGALQARRVTVLADRAVAIGVNSVRLGCGGELMSDATLLATGTQPALRLADSGLALNDQGFMALDAYHRSTSHSHIFAAGGAGGTALSGVYDVRANPLWVNNLAAAVVGGALKPHLQSVNRLSLIGTGPQHAVGAWGAYSAQGRWLGYLKNALDRRGIAPKV